FEVLDPVEADGNLRVDQRIDQQGRLVSRLLERMARPSRPARVVGRDVEDHAAVDEDRRHVLRVSARIASVDNLTVARPFSRPTTLRPLVPRRAPRARTMRIAFPSTMKSTSVFG